MGTQIKRVRGLGSAHEGVGHWWHQRLTAGTNLALVAWLMLSLLRLPAYDYAGLRAWASSAWVAIPLLLFVASTFYHFRLGLQVVIEDYQKDERRVAAMVLLNVYVAAMIIIAGFAILKIAFAAAPVAAAAAGAAR
jgi:succinate dehydrogenase / fumarate reductase, membrane anchor subunit